MGRSVFKNLLKELETLKNTTSISVPIKPDTEDYYDKECPAESCLFGFKVFGDDWTNIVRDEEVFCPACRHRAPAKSWYTREQIEQAKEYAFKQVQAGLDRAMVNDAKDWNRRQPRNGFLTITMDVKGFSTPLLMPIAAAEPMRLRTACDACGCRYSYIGAAFFCPSCGENSARHTFKQTLTTIRTAATTGEILRKSLGTDEAEVLIRSLLEKGFQDTVMSFQRLNEQIYAQIAGAQVARRNAFQNLDDGSELWTKAVGRSFDAMLSSDEARRLRIYFQQRHLIAHRQGIVDRNYLLRSGDATYAIGQRLVIRETAVIDFVDLVERLGNAIIEFQPGNGSHIQKADSAS